MSEAGAPDRTRLLRSKHDQLRGIVTSRKRKLRELWAVCDNESPLPNPDLSNLDVPPTTVAEKEFLEVTDILQNRLFKENNLPARRQLRSDTSKQRSPARRTSPDTRTNDSSRKAPKIQRDGSKSRKSRAPTPSARSDGGYSNTNSNTTLEAGDAEQGLPMQRSTSKSSQTDLPTESSAILNEIVEETFDNATKPETSLPDAVIPEDELESERIRQIESRPNSPGADPRKVMPISAEDAANLPGPIIEGLGSHDQPHKARTVHLPPKEVQEKHLQQTEAGEQREQTLGLSIHLPGRDGGRSAEIVSSPGSTIDAHSATTPAMHEASTDTSPDNESSRFDADRIESKDEDPETPVELKKSPEEIAEKAEHDRIHQAQMDIARAEIMRSSPNVDSQLMEEQAASVREEVQDSQDEDDTTPVVQEPVDSLTKEAAEAVQDIIEDEDEVVGIPTPDDDSAQPEPSTTKSTREEVADSEDSTPVEDAMDVDVTTVKDSFESANTTEITTAPAPETSESSSNTTTNYSKDAPATPTPKRTPSIPAIPPPVLERMTTRVGSGAMRHKSVSEILGETPKPSTSSSSSTAPKDIESTANSQSTSRSMTPQSPGTRVQRLAEKAREKERSKLSTVVFPGRPPRPATSSNAVVSNGSPSDAVKDDYFMPLFRATAPIEKSRVSLNNLLQQAHKTITTSNAYVPIIENQTEKVLKRIYNLQSSNKWSLRQPKRSPEPIRPTAHWDVLLQEVKWMRTDFREERKWKMMVAKNLAYDCAEWVESDTEERKLLQVKATAPNPPSKDITMGEASSAAHPTPDLVASEAFDSLDDEDEPRLNLLETVSPTAIFGLQADEVVFGLRRSPTTDKLLEELPMYGAPLQVPQSEFPTSETDPDRFWRRPALPLSKFVEGRLELKTSEPPRKRSRFQYEQEDDEEDQVVFGDQSTKRPILPPQSTDVALFNPEHRHIRDRIHASHQFRPPSEFPMPLQSFFECRVPSQWTHDEDNELKDLVREYSYNWSLISSMLTSKSMLSSGAERRTPWESFERWIHLEGLPADMQKTHYFRAYTTRIDTANRAVMALAQPQPPNAQGQPPPPTRNRRPTTSVRVERRRTQKHITLVDAMRKLAKRRETQVQKQQHAAGIAAMRKAQEPAHAGRTIPPTTPQEFSRIKAEREEAIKERLIQLQKRQEEQRRIAIQQSRGVVPGQNPQQPGLPNGVPRPPSGTGMPGTPSGQNLTVPGQRPRGPMPPQLPGQSMPGMRAPQIPMNGVPTAPMQGQMPPPNPALDIALRAQQVSQHQQMLRQQQQGQMNGQMHNSPPRINGMPQPFPMQGSMMPPFNPNGVSTPPANGHATPAHGQAGSPRMSQPQHNGLTHIQMLEHTLKKQYPQSTQEQITAMISQTLKQQQQKQGIAQSAMNAAAGAGMGQGAGGTPQAYAQMLRQHTQAQAQMQASNSSTSGNSQAQGSGGTGNSGQGHAHRNSSGSVPSAK